MPRFPIRNPALHKMLTAFYPQGQCTAKLSCYSVERPESAEDLSRYTADNVPRLVRRLVLNSYRPASFKEPSNKLHPFATDTAFGAHQLPADWTAGSFRFSPPLCYQASQAGISTLLRNHLPPHIASVSLGLPLELPYPCLLQVLRERYQASSVKACSL